MHWTAILVWTLILKYSSQQCLSEDDTLSSTARTEDKTKTISSGSSKFTFELFKDVAAKTNGVTDNLFISPISVWSVLGITLLGARGKTASQLEMALHLQGVSKSEFISAFLDFRNLLLHQANDKANYTFNLANKVFFDSNSEIRECIGKTNLNAELQSVDFVTNPEEFRQTINHWAENMTTNKIQDLIQEGAVDQTTTMVFVNAAYFKGIWKEKFTDSRKNEFFFIKPDQPVKVTMMSITKSFRVGDDATLDCSAVELPYSGGDVSMIILLPNTNIEDLIPKLTPEKVNNLYDSLATYHINVQLPKFKVEQTTDLKEYIQKLGANNMFNAELADFSGFSGDQKYYVSFIRQKAYIAVDEKGTEAAAATGLVLSITSITTSNRRPFICNKPFVYFIRNNNSGTILFGGIIRKPEYN